MPQTFPIVFLDGTEAVLPVYHVEDEQWPEDEPTAYVRRGDERVYLISCTGHYREAQYDPGRGGFC